MLLGLGIWTLADRSIMNELLGTNLFSGTVYVLIGAAREVKSLLLFVSESYSSEFSMFCFLICEM